MENKKEYAFITTEVITRKYYVIKKRSRRPEFIGLKQLVGKSKLVLVDAFQALECDSTTDAQSWLESYLKENKDEKREDFDIVLLEIEVKYPTIEYTW